MSNPPISDHYYGDVLSFWLVNLGHITMVQITIWFANKIGICYWLFKLAKPSSYMDLINFAGVYSNPRIDSKDRNW